MTNGFNGGNNNGYQSGGAYRSPAGDLQSIIYNQYLQQVAGGDLDNLNNMSWDEFSANLQAANANLFQFANDTVTNQERIASHFQQIVGSAKSLQQALNKAAEFAYKLGENQVEYSKSIHQARGGDPDNKTALGQMVNNAMLQSVHIQQQILNRLNGMNDALVELNQGADKNQFQEASLFDELKQTLLNSILHNPTTQKIGGLVSGLMNAGLFSVAANEKAPEPLRKAAMLAVHFQVPETITMIVGEVIRVVLAGWLFGKASGILTKGLEAGAKATGGGILKIAKTGFTGLFSGLGRLFQGAMSALSGLVGALAPLAPLLIGLAGAIAIAYVGTKIKQATDKKIDENPNLTQDEKDKRHATNHIVGDTVTGTGIGASIGAGIGLAGGPFAGITVPVGTAVGALIGGLGGLAKGTWDSFMNGWIGKDKKKDQNKQSEFAQLNDTFNEKFESLSETLNSIDENVQQILQALTTGASLFGGSGSGGILGAFKALGEKIKNSSWWQEHVGTGGEEGGGGSSGAYKQYADNSTKTMWDKRAKPKANSDYEDMRTLKAKYGLKGAIDKNNSVPWLKKKNVGAMLQLDSMLNQWGFDVVYTSNMGGNHKGGAKSHASGNKVDLQLFRNGKPAYLNAKQLAQLKAKGYFGGNTGALGWEKNAKQIGGGHYDLTTSASFVKVDRSNEAINSAISRYEKDQAEAHRKQQAKEATDKSKDGKKIIQNILNSASNLVKSKTSFGDVTGMNDYIHMNTTNSKVNRG